MTRRHKKTGRKSTARPARPAVMLAGLVLFLASCHNPSAAEDAVRGIRVASQDTRLLARSKWVPPRYPPPILIGPTKQQVDAEANLLFATVADLHLTVDEYKEAVTAACQAADAFEVATKQEDAATYLVTRIDSPYAKRVEVQNLANALDQAGSDRQQQAKILGRAALCTWASN